MEETSRITEMAFVHLILIVLIVFSFSFVALALGTILQNKRLTGCSSSRINVQGDIIRCPSCKEFENCALDAGDEGAPRNILDPET